MPRPTAPPPRSTHADADDRGGVRVWHVVLVQSVLAALLMLGIVLARPARGGPVGADASYPHAVEAR